VLLDEKTDVVWKNGVSRTLGLRWTWKIISPLQK